MAIAPKTMSLKQFQDLIPDEKVAVAYFEGIRWADSVTCPYCGADKIQRVRNAKPMPFRCRACREHFSVKTGTVMQNSKIGVRVWLMAMYFLSVAKKSVSSCQMARQLGVRQVTAWFLCQRIREAWNQGRFLLDGKVEMDETYIGGKEKNKHNNKKFRGGRGAVGKVPVVGLKQREGRMYAVVSKTPSKKVLYEIIDERVCPTSTLYADDHRGYIGANVCQHIAVKHSVGEYVCGEAGTNGVESFWALLKRGYYETYHKMSARHLSRYVDEFVTRQNALGQPTIEQMKFTLSSAVGKRLTYKDLTQ